MKTKIIIILIIIFNLNSCKKKCTECSNICYVCTDFNDPICSTSFTSKEMFNKTKKFLNDEGIVCNKITPTISFEECDKDKIKIFENDYECT